MKQTEDSGGSRVDREVNQPAQPQPDIFYLDQSRIATIRISSIRLIEYVSVSQQNIPDIFSCNFRKHCRIFIMFGTHVTEEVSNQ